MAIPLELLLSATGGHCAHRGAEEFSAVVIDGRVVPKGALFFAIAGENHDGHDFVRQAVAGGADGVVVKKGRPIEGAASATVVEVDDTVAALGKLAHAHRERMGANDLRVVAITGSNGKTTTKEMTAAILSSQVGPDAVLKTEGNLNNHLGVPLTLLRLTPKHHYAVVEMGMSGLGEIEYLAKMAHPDVAVVVSVAPVHLEQLGTIENIARAKGEIWQGRATGVAPLDEPLLKPYWPKKMVTFGKRADGGPDVGVDEVHAGPHGVSFTLHLRELTSRQGVNVNLPLVGAHNALDAAAAAAAARALDVGEGPILDGLSRVRPAKHRSQLVPTRDRTILDDCYNASPLSMRAAVDALVSVAQHKKIAVLGDMLELGPKSAELHAEIGAYAGERVDELIAFGPLAAHLAEAAAQKLGAEHVLHTQDPVDAAERVLQVSGPGDVILVKASRGMRLERVIDRLLETLS